MVEYKYYTCKYDKPFKEIFLNKKNEDLLKGLLETVLKVKINEIEVQPNERNTNNLEVKRKTYDALLKTDQGKIEIEVNANSKKSYIKPRNMAYICDLYSHHTLVGDEYSEDTKIIQINFSYGLGKKEEKLRKYYIQDDSKKKFIKNLEIIEINMDYFLEIWYSKNEKKIKENTYLVMLGLEKEELKKLSLESNEVKKYMSELDRINEDPFFRDYMSEEEDKRKIHNSELREAREKGIKAGIEKKTIEMVKSFYEQKFPIEAIMKASKLTKEEILEIINK